MPARLITFRYDFEGKWEDVDLDVVREQIGNGTSEIYSDKTLDVSDEDDPNDRPRDSCGCGYEVVWVEGSWQHDAAPSFWGDDHGTDQVPPPARTDAGRIEWDVEDGISKLVEARASELEKGDVYREYGDDDWTETARLLHHGDTVLIDTKDESEISLDIDTVVERVVTA